MSADSIKKNFFKLNSEIAEVMKEANNIKPYFIYFFNKKKIKSVNTKITKLLMEIFNLDEDIDKNVFISDHVGDLNKSAPQFAMLVNSRNIALTSLEEVKKSISDTENIVFFKFTSFIAIVALAVSIIGILVSLN